MKARKWVVVLVALGLVLAGCARGPKLGKVKIGTDAEYPPFEFVDEQGEIAGFDVELMTAIAKEAGFEFEFVNTRWDGIFVALASGELKVRELEDKLEELARAFT